MSKCALFLLFTLLVSCSTTKSSKVLKKELTREEEHFFYTDKNGQYLAKISSGYNKKDHSYFSKKSLEISDRVEDKILEQSVVLSELGSIKKKRTILRPKLSQYNVWFEGKKYFSELKINPSKKAIDVKMVSPEKQWNGTKQVKLPSTKALYCFFSQVIECAKAAGFLSESIRKETGTMNFYIIWEGYPYLNETFSDFPSELISKAQLEYDGKVKDDENRFDLKVAGQSIFFMVDKDQQMKKMFWVSQGISMVSKLAKRTNEDMKKKGESIE
ncbi:MAG: hypothetical protein KBD76_07035 [Bacteriovorax sp.]|jgi:hypothetical protein|nr:hypothetical protein [Bacteriovorax sp.]